MPSEKPARPECVTFTEPAFVLFDPEENAVRSTMHGNLAIFSTRGVAEQFVAKAVKRLEVRAVRIVPVLP